MFTLILRGLLREISKMVNNVDKTKFVDNNGVLGKKKQKKNKAISMMRRKSPPSELI